MKVLVVNAREARIFLRKTRRINNEGFSSKRKP